MQFTIPSEVKEIIKTVENAGYEIYIVGGAVRDLLMGRNVDDWDFTTNAKPEDITKLFPDSFYDNKFGTVGIPSEEENINPHEITTFRSEKGYSDSRHPDEITWGTTLDEDLKRRDFTINAMAIKHTTKKDSDEFDLIDLYNGQKDLKAKIVKAVGEPTERFSEDALRMMRAIRIASQLGFKIEENTFEAIKTHAALINKIAKERVKDELMKIIESKHADEGILILKDSKILSEILPEVEKMFGVEQKSPQRHHIHDVGTHSINALKNCKSTNPIVRFATFIHDIGKPQTYKVTNEGVITFYNHEMVGFHIAKRIAERLRFSKKETDKLLKLVRWHQFTVDERQTDAAIRRFIKKVGQDNIEDMLILRTADRLGGGASETSWRFEEFKNRLIEVQKQPFNLRDLKITGSDIMNELNLKPSPKVGEILNKLFKEVVDKKIENNKEELMKRLKELD